MRINPTLLPVAALLLLGATNANAVIYDRTIEGTDAIFLAGRTDITVPDDGLAWNSPAEGFLTRHGGNTPEELVFDMRETFPDLIGVAGGDVVRVLDPGIGGVDFFNGIGNNYFGPDGNGATGSNLNGLGAISGYLGPQGPLVGVFIGAGSPSNPGDRPATLDFRPTGTGTDFTSLSPLLNQIFYIGDGINSGGIFQEFIAPAGATRLALGIPDGFGFTGHPGAYDDNDGSYRIVIGVNEVPRFLPAPGTGVLLLSGLAIAAWRRGRARG